MGYRDAASSGYRRRLYAFGSPPLVFLSDITSPNAFLDNFHEATNRALTKLVNTCAFELSR